MSKAKIQESLQLSIDFEESKVTITKQVTTEIDLEALYAYDPDEPWWNR